MPTVTVATDGSALNNPHGVGGWAWVVDKNSWKAASAPKATNNQMELYAIIRALQDIPKHYNLIILTDSQLIVNTFGPNMRSGWIKKWKKNGWKTAKGKVKNVNFLELVEKSLEERTGKTELRWVRGHNGHPLNTVADKLCTSASRAAANRLPVQTGPGWNEQSLETPSLELTKPKPRTKKPAPATPPAKPTGPIPIPKKTTRTVIPSKYDKPTDAIAGGGIAPKRKPASTPFTTHKKTTTTTTTTGTGTPAQPPTTRKTTPTRRRKKPAPDRTITTFDDGPELEVIKPTVKHELKTCDSCGGRIHPATSHCNCFTS